MIVPLSVSDPGLWGSSSPSVSLIAVRASAMELSRDCPRCVMAMAVEGQWLPVPYGAVLLLCYSTYVKTRVYSR
jgi:hypothetical protein